MRRLVALVGLIWSVGNLLLAYQLVTSGLAGKTVAKGLALQFALWSGGLLIAVFALLLAWQCVRLAASRDQLGDSDSLHLD
jgi:hypothetical protein